ncbi:MAG: integration host factor subunit alpha [Deferribacterales bacterium]|nr:integration host factor subunit alpha [Deferribacterales bacterium]
MTKADIVESIHEKFGLTKKVISKVVDDVFDTIRGDILEGKNVKISGFGNFEVKKRGRRIGRNPKTGEEKIIPPRTVVVFRPSQIFKDEVNG